MLVLSTMLVIYMKGVLVKSVRMKKAFYILFHGVNKFSITFTKFPHSLLALPYYRRLLVAWALFCLIIN